MLPGAGTASCAHGGGRLLLGRASPGGARPGEFGPAVGDAVAKREGVRLRNMTDPVADDESAEYLEGDYLTVEQLARLRQVTPAAVRAQLRAGNLAGEQVLQGQRTVWRIPVDAARRYLDRPGGAPSAGKEPPTSPPAPPAPTAPTAPTAPPAEVRRPVPATPP